MFNGYRLKIEGIEFNDSYVAKGTYSCVNQKRVIETWKDANEVEHEVTAPIKKAVISFDIREHNSIEHANIIPFFQKEDDITIEYYNDLTDEYLTGNFRRSNVQFSHLNLTRENIDYSSASVVFTEN